MAGQIKPGKVKGLEELLAKGVSITARPMSDGTMALVIEDPHTAISGVVGNEGKLMPPKDYKRLGEQKRNLERKVRFTDYIDTVRDWVHKGKAPARDDEKEDRSYTPMDAIEDALKFVGKELGAYYVSFISNLKMKTERGNDNVYVEVFKKNGTYGVATPELMDIIYKARLTSELKELMGIDFKENEDKVFQGLGREIVVGYYGKDKKKISLNGSFMTFYIKPGNEVVGAMQILGAKELDESDKKYVAKIVMHMDTFLLDMMLDMGVQITSWEGGENTTNQALGIVDGTAGAEEEVIDLVELEPVEDEAPAETEGNAAQEDAQTPSLSQMSTDIDGLAEEYLGAGSATDKMNHKITAPRAERTEKKGRYCKTGAYFDIMRNDVKDGIVQFVSGLQYEKKEDIDSFMAMLSGEAKMANYNNSVEFINDLHKNRPGIMIKESEIAKDRQSAITLAEIIGGAVDIYADIFLDGIKDKATGKTLIEAYRCPTLGNKRVSKEDLKDAMMFVGMFARAVKYMPQADKIKDIDKIRQNNNVTDMTTYLSLIVENIRGMYKHYGQSLQNTDMGAIIVDISNKISDRKESGLVVEFIEKAIEYEELVQESTSSPAMPIDEALKKTYDSSESRYDTISTFMIDSLVSVPGQLQRPHLSKYVEPWHPVIFSERSL